MGPQTATAATRAVTPVRNQSGSHNAIVSCIGTEPMLNIPGIGEVRFAYRHVKKMSGEKKPVVNVGDHVTCRLTPGEPPRAVSVRIVNKAKPISVPVPIPSVTPRMVPSTPNSYKREIMRHASTGSADSIHSMGVDNDSFAQSVSFSYDPYCETGFCKKYEYGMSSPSLTVGPSPSISAHTLSSYLPMSPMSSMQHVPHRSSIASSSGMNLIDQHDY